MPRHPPYTLNNLTLFLLLTHMAFIMAYSIVKEPKMSDKNLIAHSILLEIARELSKLVELSGIEPLTPCLQSRRSPN